MKKTLINLTIILIVATFLQSCQAQSTSVSNPEKTDGSEQKTVVEEQNNEENKEPKAEVNTAVDTTLGAGTFYVDTDLPAGRYQITAPECDYGYISIRMGEADYIINEILGINGVKNITTNLPPEAIIEITGTNAVRFEPYTEVMSNVLGAGYWGVGENIEAGRYVVSVEKKFGNFTVYDSNGTVKTFEILGDGYVNDLTTDLKDGDVIYISGLDDVNFTKK